MAISAENKARSIQCYGPGTGIGPRPDAAFEAGHAAHIAWIYAGITFATGAPAPTAEFGWRPFWKPRRR